MEGFYREVKMIEDEAKNFIDESFKTLRSAEGAFDMLLKFKHIRSREAINNLMMRKFSDILTQYSKEVGLSIVIIIILLIFHNIFLFFAVAKTKFVKNLCYYNQSLAIRLGLLSRCFPALLLFLL